MKQISVKAFYYNMKKRLKLSRVTKFDLAGDRYIKQNRLNKPGLVLAGYSKYFKWDNIQILDKPEIEFINMTIKEKGLDHFKKICTYRIPCIINLCRKQLDPGFIKLCEDAQIPILKTSLTYAKFIMSIMDFLDEFFAPTTQIHGTLVDVYGTGLLLMGRSGIGKSEIALDLVERGHRLVTDDVVTVVKRADNFLIGKSQEEFGSFMEIRGLGIINIKELFGTRAIRLQKRVEVIVQLEDWVQGRDYERVGLEEDILKIHGVSIPRVKLPIFPGKNITVIAETIALNLHLKVYGYNAAQEMNKLLIRKMKRKQKASKLSNYLAYDYE